MDGLRTSLNIPGGEGLSYSPYGQRFSPGQYLQGILELVEMERQRRQTKSLIESILGTTTAAKKIAPIVGTPTLGTEGTLTTIPTERGLEQLPIERRIEQLPYAGPEAPKRGLLSKIGTAIGGLFDVSRAPKEMVPLEQTIAEAIFKAKLEGPKKWEPTSKEEAIEFETAKRKKGLTAKQEVEERFLAGEELTPEEKKLIEVYIAPEKPTKLTPYQKEQEAEELRKVIGALTGGKYYLPGSLGALMEKKITTPEEAIQFLLTPPSGYEAYPQYEEVPEIMDILKKRYPEKFGAIKQGGMVVGQIIQRGGKKWKIVGFDKDGDPLVEEVK